MSARTSSVQGNWRWGSSLRTLLPLKGGNGGFCGMRVQQIWPIVHLRRTLHERTSRKGIWLGGMEPSHSMGERFIAKQPHGSLGSTRLHWGSWCDRTRNRPMPHGTPFSRGLKSLFSCGCLAKMIHGVNRLAQVPRKKEEMCTFVIPQSFLYFCQQAIGMVL